MFRVNSPISAVTVALVAALALTACGSSSPSASTGTNSNHPSPAQLQSEQNQGVALANCLRSHGVPNFPDPTTSPRAFKDTLSAGAPALLLAERSCVRLMPAQPHNNQTTSPTHKQITAMLALAHCMRSHGFRRFPDPSAGQLTHQMLAAADIDLKQPAFLHAGDACVSVTHGLLTKVDVARFIAGN